MARKAEHRNARANKPIDPKRRIMNTTKRPSTQSNHAAAQKVRPPVNGTKAIARDPIPKSVKNAAGKVIERADSAPLGPPQAATHKPESERPLPGVRQKARRAKKGSAAIPASASRHAVQAASADPLDSLRTELNSAQMNLKRLAKAFILAAIEMGLKLELARDALGEGANWIAQLNVAITPREDALYTQLAKQCAGFKGRLELHVDIMPARVLELVFDAYRRAGG